MAYPNLNLAIQPPRRPQGGMAPQRRYPARQYPQQKPKDPMLAQGDLQINDGGVFFTPRQSETVEGRMAGILSRGSPYIESARSRAMQTANRRGLLNTSIAAGEGERAAIESALPIVQQDAGFMQQRNLARQGGLIQSRLQAEQGDISSRLQAEQGDISSRLQGEMGDIQKGLYETQGDISSRLQREKGDVERGLIGARGDVERSIVGMKGEFESRLQRERGAEEQRQLQMQGDITSRLQAEEAQQRQRLQEIQAQLEGQLRQAGYDHEVVMQEMRDEWNRMDLETRQQIEYDRMAQENQFEFNRLANNISEDYMNDYMEIIMNPNLATVADRNAAIFVLNENTKRRYEAAGAVAQVELTWPGVPEGSTELPMQPPY